MKHIFWTFIIGIVIGICVQYFWINKHIPSLNHDSIHDTISLSKDSIQYRDSVIYVDKFPNEFVKSLDSISIDTINTVINGKVTESKLKVIIK